MTSLLRALALGAFLTLTLPGVATGATIDFDDLLHGEVVAPDRYAELGVRIETWNADLEHRIGAGFDSTLELTRDPDLEDPWSVGNLSGPTMLGRVLIIQEDPRSCRDNRCRLPDDEGSRPGGYFHLTFEDSVESFGLDLIDIDDHTDENGGLLFFAGGLLVGEVSWDELEGRLIPGVGEIAYGENSANTLPLFLASDYGVDGFDEIRILMGGSGAVDNLRFEAAVPEPSSALVFAIGLGVVARRARRVRS